jgi:hypothetical protein
MGLWPAVVGDSLARQSRPLFIDYENNLVVSVKDAALGQELSLRKREIVRHLKQIGAGLGIAVSGLRFDLKHFHKSVSENEDSNSVPIGRLVEPSAEELAAITLTTEELGELATLAQELGNSQAASNSTLGAEINLSNRIAHICELEIRLRKWRTAHGFPKCNQCLEPSSMLYGRQRLCGDCFYRTLL